VRYPPSGFHYILFPYMMAFFGTFNSTELLFMPKVDDRHGCGVAMSSGA
jgi:hypothetical protein